MDQQEFMQQRMLDAQHPDPNADTTSRGLNATAGSQHSTGSLYGAPSAGSQANQASYESQMRAGQPNVTPGQHTMSNNVSAPATDHWGTTQSQPKYAPPPVTRSPGVIAPGGVINQMNSASMPSHSDLSSTQGLFEEAHKQNYNFSNHWDQGAIAQQNASRGQQDQSYGAASDQAAGRSDAANKQNTAYGLSLAAAQGNAPSAAESMYQRSVLQANQALRQGVSNTTAQGMSMAASSRGGLANAAMAQRQAMMQAGRANLQGAIGINENLQNAAATNAALRASEMAQARGEVGGVAGQMRGAELQGVGLMGQQANATRQQDLQNAGLSMQRTAADTAQNVSNQQNNDKNQLTYTQLGLGKNQSENQFAWAQDQAEADRAFQREALGKNVGIQNRQLDMQNASNWINAVSSGGAATGQILQGIGQMSDVRVKDNISPASAEGVMGSLTPFNFTYKNDPEKKPHMGVMAQDLEKTPQGKTAVVDTPAGKFIRGDVALGLSLASVANLHNRVAKLEGSTK